MTADYRLKVLQDIWSAVQSDAELVRNNQAAEYTKERVERALYDRPWLMKRYQRNDGQVLTTSYRHDQGDVSWEEHAQRFSMSAPFLYRRAIAARELAMSYRDFRVTSSGLFWRTGSSREQGWKVFAGMNTKHARNMRPVCSEPITINGALAEGYDLMIGIVIVGELREEDVGVIETLHPCQDCRWFMHGHPAVRGDSIIVTAQPPQFDGDSKEERHTFSEMLTLHRDISGDDFD